MTEWKFELVANETHYETYDEQRRFCPMVNKTIDGLKADIQAKIDETYMNKNMSLENKKYWLDVYSSYKIIKVTTNREFV